MIVRKAFAYMGGWMHQRRQWNGGGSIRLLEVEWRWFHLIRADDAV
jgi:hypothetical protein